MYCEDVKLDQELVVVLLKNIKEFDLPELKMICERYLVKTLSIENIADVSKVVDNHEADRLKKAVIEYIITNRHLISQQNISRIPNSILVETLKKGPESAPADI